MTDNEEYTTVNEIESVHSSYYDIFEKEVEDISTNSLQYIEYYDVNVNGPNAVSDFRIEVKDKENWFIPSKAYIECRVSLTRNDGTAVQGADNAGIQNNAIGLFKRWELMYDDEIIEAVDDADICNTIQSLVYFSKDYAESIASNQLWYPDTADSSLREYNIVAGNQLFDRMEGVNLGHRKRRNVTDAAFFQTTLHLPLLNVFGFLKSYSGVTRGMKLSLRLTKNDDNRMLLCAGNNCTVVFNWVSLWIPRVMPNVSILKNLLQKLNNDASHLIPYVDAQIFRSNLITATANNQAFQIKVKRRRPIKCFIAFQNQNRVTGDQTFVKRIFDHVQLKKLRLVLNSTTQYPEREYIVEFSATRYDYARVYNELMRCGLKDHDIHAGSVVTYDNFPTLFPIFCIDLTEQFEYNVQPESSLIDVYWTNDVVTNYYMYVVIESERKLEVVGSNGKMQYKATH